MATLDELQAQLAALTQRVNEITAPPDDYYTHRFSGEEIDNAVGRVADTPGSGAITAGDVGAAPSGFGWGNVLRDISVASREETYEEFCAKVDAVISAMPDQTAALVRAYPPAVYGRAGTTMSILFKNTSNYCVLSNVGSGDSTLYGWRMYKDNNEWFPFEWVVPPMALGVEYRTTERHNNKPVYKIAWPAGDFPNNTTKTVTVDTGTAGAVKAISSRTVLDTSGAQANGMYGNAQTVSTNLLGMFLQSSSSNGTFLVTLGSNRDVNDTATIFIDYIRG